VRGLEIPIDFYRAPQLRSRFLVLAKEDLGDALEGLPMIGGRVAGAEPQRVPDVGRGFLTSPKKGFSKTNPCVSGRQIPVDCKSPFELGDPLHSPVGVDLNDPETEVPQRLFGGD
jgi:hypothetical protein